MTNDEMRAKMAPPQEPLPLVDYMFQHLAGVWAGLEAPHAAALAAEYALTSFLGYSGHDLLCTTPHGKPAQRVVVHWFMRGAVPSSRLVGMTDPLRHPLLACRRVRHT